MQTIYEVDPQQLIEATAEELKQEYDAVDMPEWAEYVKTGVDRERPPQQEDWWYIRSAAVLRNIYKEGPLGTERLRSMYGGKHRRGHQTEHFAKGSGKVIRTVLQQLEDADLVELEEGEGRQITPDGQRLLDAAAKKTGE
ncbi:MAG: 30S ribosomal protein S19e [Candidatus Nanohaloarchaea archaeon]|nr:30S ribosomal protein S19e [Candidatus Nanohaloarchaea archaeon]